MGLRLANESVPVLVAEDFVQSEREPDPGGSEGILRVDVVEETPAGVLVSLPGEPQGAFARVSVPPHLLQVA